VGGWGGGMLVLIRGFCFGDFFFSVFFMECCDREF